MTEEKTSRRGRRSHMNTVVVLLVVMICSVVTGSAGYVVYTQNRPAPSASPLEPEGRVQSGTLINQEGKQAELDAIVQEGMLTFTINVTPMMRDGKSEADLMIENLPDNGNQFIVTIIREDTGEEIYKSSYPDPGQYIENTPPDAELPTREYRYIASPDAYRISDNVYIGRGEVQIILYV